MCDEQVQWQLQDWPNVGVVSLLVSVTGSRLLPAGVGVNSGSGVILEFGCD